MFYSCMKLVVFYEYNYSLVIIVYYYSNLFLLKGFSEKSTKLNSFFNSLCFYY